VVSYDRKHNEANAENNRDGIDANWSWNGGVEGATTDPRIEALRERQIRNFFTLLLSSLGVPMLLMGDEVRRTQHGNNNAYCQDNSLSWFDWNLVDEHRALHRFVKLLITLRRRGAAEQGRPPGISLNQLLREATFVWSGVKIGQPDWSEQSHSLACTAMSQRGFELHAMWNAYWEPLTFELPPLAKTGSCWRRIIDTSLSSPHDLCSYDQAPAIESATYTLQPRSIAYVATHSEAGAADASTGRPHFD
jgi:glycogen operon protein